MVPNDKLGQIGKPVKFRYGPAAVIGDQRRNMPLSDLLSEACEKCSILHKPRDGKARQVERSESQKTCH
jgi:hypothetical protein